MRLHLKGLILMLCALCLSGCIVQKSKLDEALAKCAAMESDLRNKDQDLVKHDNEISDLQAVNKGLAADAEKAKLLCNDELTKAKSTQEQIDAELLKTKGVVVEKDKQILAIKTEVVEKDRELMLLKDEMARKLMEKDKQNENLMYTVREIESRAQSLLEKIKSIQ